MSQWLKKENNIYNSLQVISSVQQFQDSSWTGFATFAPFPLHRDCTDYCWDYPEPSFGGHCILYQLFVSCAFSAKLTLPFLSFPTGYHCSLRKAPLAHSISKLHDDQRPERQPGRELHDDHDSHTLFREKEYRRTLVLLSGDLSLSFCASLWDGVQGPGWVSVFSAGLGCAFRGKDAPRIQSLGLCASAEIPPFENWVHIARDGLQKTLYTRFGRPADGLFTLAGDLKEETHQLLLTLLHSWLLRCLGDITKVWA